MKNSCAEGWMVLEEAVKEVFDGDEFMPVALCLTNRCN